MPEELMVHYCAPTLAGLKTGSMFSCEVEDKAALTRGLVAYNRVLVPRGLRAVPLRFSDRRALIYVYRPGRLAHDLEKEAAKDILAARCYPVGQAERCTAELGRSPARGRALSRLPARGCRRFYPERRARCQMRRCLESLRR